MFRVALLLTAIVALFAGPLAVPASAARTSSANPPPNVAKSGPTFPTGPTYPTGPIYPVGPIYPSGPIRGTIGGGSLSK
jgi:hypothetical protein